MRRSGPKRRDQVRSVTLEGGPVQIAPLSWEYDVEILAAWRAVRVTPRDGSKRFGVLFGSVRYG